MTYFRDAFQRFIGPLEDDHSGCGCDACTAARDYDPSEPRVPSGPGGGEWTAGGAGSKAEASRGAQGAAAVHGEGELPEAQKGQRGPAAAQAVAGGRGGSTSSGGGAGGSGSVRAAQESAAKVAGGHKPLNGLPQNPLKLGDDYYVPGPISRLRDAARDYMAKAGLPYAPVADYVKLDKERAKRIADAFDAMPNAPDDPAVKASYAALAKETLGQWEAAKATGLKVEWIKPGQPDPYASSPRLAAMDVAEHNHWWGFPTDLGYGSGEHVDQSNNPMLQPTGEVVDGRKVVLNDIFRVVHDVYGHFKEGNGFRAEGEDNAWRSHASMFSRAALPAMTAETRGQNSWVNFGPYGETNRTASAGETHYAPQKIGIMPDWTFEDIAKGKSLVRDFDPGEPRAPKGESTGGQWVGLKGSSGRPATISTRPVTATGKTEKERAAASEATGVYKTINMEAMKAAPAQFKANTALFKDARFYPGMRPEEVKGKDDEVAKAVTDRMVDNLMFLANTVKADDKASGTNNFERWGGWYEGAHKIAEANAKKYKTDIASASGVIAALSPQNDWNGNVYQADVVMDALANKQSMSWDAKMQETSDRIWKGQRLKMAGEISGKTLLELSLPMKGDPSDAEQAKSLQLARMAMWIRTENEAHSDRQHRQVNPDGTFGDLMRTKAGEPTPAKWKNVSAIVNAITAYESDGDSSVLSQAMGDRHKVRSFYNNILDPDSSNGDVTIDTHAVGAAWLTPSTAEDASVYHALNTSPLAADKPEGFVASKGSAVTGVKGTYGFYAQAYRDAAKKLGIQPRQLQSIVWEAKQRLFSKTQTGTKVKAVVDTVWRMFNSGEITLQQAQQQVVKMARGSVG